MTAMWDFFFGPFIEFSFMRRALAATFALSVAAGPLGVFLILRRLSLMGDALSHAILPGVALGFLVAGLSLPAMMIGGVLSGLLVALFSGWVARITPMREDTSFATFYLISLGLGVLLVSVRGTNMDLLHVLFGSVLGLDNAALLTVTIVASISVLVLAVIYRPLVMDSVDPQFKRFYGRSAAWAHMLFLVLLVITLVAGFQILGTLMVVGLMILPAASARFLVQSATTQLLVAAGLAVLSSWVGLLGSFYFDVPTSPAIILVAGAFYLLALFLGPYGGLRQTLRQARKHRQKIQNVLLFVLVVGAGGGLISYTPLAVAQVGAMTPVAVAQTNPKTMAVAPQTKAYVTQTNQSSPKVMAALAQNSPQLMSAALIQNSPQLVAAAGSEAESAPLKVVGSFAIVADLIEQVGGEAVTVHSIVDPGSSAHHFEPRASDMQALVGADLFVVNGADFEPWWPKLVQSAGYKGPVLVLSEGLALRAFDEEEQAHQPAEPQQHEGHQHDEHLVGAHHHGQYDPHAWLRADYAQHYAQRIYEQLRVLLPESKHEALTLRYQDYDQQLADLHAALLAQFKDNEQACVGVVLAHDSMFYFQQAYGCPYFVSLLGASLEAEPSAKGFAQVIRDVRAQQVQAVVPEFGVDARLVEQIARETRVPIGRPLYTETFSPEVDGVDSYLSLMRWNQEVLREVLGL